MSDEGGGRERSRGKERGERKWEEKRRRESGESGELAGEVVGVEEETGKRERLEHNKIYSLSFDC